MIDRSSFAGAMLGLALGDALGAPFEGGLLERALWRWIGRTPDGRLRWTDDTQMAIDLAQSLIERGGVDQAHLAATLSRGYRWSRGYGPGAARTLRRIGRGQDWRVANRAAFAEGSFGNGAAVRAPVLGLFYAGEVGSLAGAVRASAEVTHAHPLAQEGASLIALATATAAGAAEPAAIFDAARAVCVHDEFHRRIDLARTLLCSADVAPEEVRSRLGNGVAAAESCVTALFLALRFLDAPFADMHRFAIACGGDVDSIGAMAGAIWGARRGEAALPAAALERIEGADRLRRIAGDLHDRARRG